MPAPAPWLRVIIIDRAAADRAALRALLARHACIIVIGEADALATGRALMLAGHYDVVFCSVGLDSGSGFDLVRFLPPAARFIFVTHDAAHAGRAYDVNASDYLVKPVTPARLGEALRRISAGQRPAAMVAERERAAAAAEPSGRVELRLDCATLRNIALAEIILVRSCQNYSHVQLRGLRYVVRETMKSWEQRLPAGHFVRVHRHVIIGLAHYRSAELVATGTSRLQLQWLDESVPASYRYLPRLRQRLAALGQQL